MRKIIKAIFYNFKTLLRKPFDIFNHNKVHSSTRIAGGVSLKFCTIGKHNYIARRDSLYNVDVGNYCCFGPDIHIGGMQHSYWWYSMSPILSDECKTPERTIIGNDVWLGAGCIIKQGVKIGDGAVVGAGSFVNKDVEPFSIVVGSPAKLLKYRFDEDVRDAIIMSGYWEKDPVEAKHILNNLNKL